MIEPSGRERGEDREVRLLLEAIYERYGYDFRDYAMTSIRRRIRDRMRAEGSVTMRALREKVLSDQDALDRLLLGLSVSVSAVFRDPGFYLAFRTHIIPRLRTYPFLRFWHAGCSTGEEVYSIAILLHEEGLYERSRIYATDISETVLARARDGIYPLSAMKQYTANYLQAGGQADFSAYYTASYEGARFRQSLRDNIVFAPHNLAVDGPFNEFQVILCRNVMIYFNKQLQRRVHELFLQSLVRLGYLCLGTRESLAYSGVEDRYETVDGNQKIYRRIV